MQLKHCEGCKYLVDDQYCSLKDKPINKIRGCSRSKSGKVFFSATNNPKEAVRREIFKNERT